MRSQLEDLGLSRRESVCYLALLELGSTTTGPLIKKTGIPSSKIYEVLERLLHRGLASFVVKSKTKRYQAADPKLLHAIVERQREIVEEIIPALVDRRAAATAPSVEIYEGRRALFGLLTNLIADARRGEAYRVFSLAEEEKDASTALFYKNIAVRRKARGIDVRVLKHRRTYVKEQHTKVKVRYTSLELPHGITIFRETILFTSWGEQVQTIRITSVQQAAQWSAFFDDIWRRAHQ